MHQGLVAADGGIGADLEIGPPQLVLDLLVTLTLVARLPRPGSPRAAEGPHPAADLAEIVRLYGLRNWIEQGYPPLWPVSSRS